MNPTSVRERGFSLIELSVVVLIIGILLTMGISAMTASFENTALSTTNQKQAAIKEALIGYLRRNSRLPCPDTDFAAPDGAENRATPNDPTTACSARFGILPYTTLGVARDATRDGWGNFFSYHVANTAGANTEWSLSANFRAGNTGNLTVNDRTAAGVMTALSTTTVAVVISHGRNSLGAYGIGGTRNALPAAGTDELDNTNGTADMVYYRRDLTTNDAATGGAFDDVVLYLSADDLFGPLFKDGTLKPAAALVQEAFQKFKLALFGFAMATTPPTGSGDAVSLTHSGASCTTGGGSPRCRVVPASDSGTNGWQNAGDFNGDLPWRDFGLAASDATDPWGVRYRYTVQTTAIAQSGWGNGIGTNVPTGSAVAVIFTSNGPDRAAGTADDITLSVSVSEIRGALAGLLPP